jgi:hypothetical protein
MCTSTNTHYNQPRDHNAVILLTLHHSQKTSHLKHPLQRLHTEENMISTSRNILQKDSFLSTTETQQLTFSSQQFGNFASLFHIHKFI